jgi:hypothetical protein
MQPTKKSRKFSILAAVFILLFGIIIGGYLVLKSGRGSASQLADILSSASKTVTGCQPDAGDTNKDSDNDGLKDWQELQIYKTDACKPDSDGDGYLDSEEIASGYDPTKKAPGDELPGTKHTTSRPLPQNLTEALRQSLKNKITQGEIPQLDASGNFLTSDQLENFPGIQSAVEEMSENYSNLFAPDKIDESQIKISPLSGKIAIQNYAAAAIAAISFSQTKSQSETEMFSNAIENNDFSEMNSHLHDYKNAYDRLKNITVPNELIDIHKEQLEIISKLIKIYSAIEDINNDPLKATLALQSYNSAAEQFKNWSNKLGDLILKNP